MVVSSKPVVVGESFSQLFSTFVGNREHVAARGPRPVHHHELETREAICPRKCLA